VFRRRKRRQEKEKRRGTHMVKPIFKQNLAAGRQKTALPGLLAALVLAAQAVAAPGVSVVPSMTSSHPGGFIFAGGKMWVSDASLGLCQVPGGGGGLGGCFKPSTSNLGVPAIVGQPSFDPATGFLYLPDMSSASNGIWRYHFNGSSFDTAVNIAASAGLGGQRPGATSLGSDGNLYVSMAGNSSIKRIHTPEGTTQVVDAMATTLDGKPANGLAAVGLQLWIAESDGVLLIADASGCGTKCRGAINTQLVGGSGVSSSGFAPTSSIAWDKATSTLYLGTPAGVYRDFVNTGTVDFYSSCYVIGAGATCTGLYSNVTAVGADGAGNAFLVDDPTAGQSTGASIYTLAAGSAPDGPGGVPQPPITVVPNFLTNELTGPGTQFALGTQRTGALWLPGAAAVPGHIWVSDAAAGFCKVDPTLPAPSLTACAVLPLGFAAGSPAFDKASNTIYLPDTTALGAGIMKMTYNPTTQTVGAATTVTTVKALTASAGAGSTAPTALAFGPDKKLYAAMGGTSVILRIVFTTTPATVSFIGLMNDISSPTLAFFQTQLWDGETLNASTMFNATLCKGTCQGQFFGVLLNLVSAVASDGTYIYIAESGDHIWRYDPAANLMQVMTTSKLVNGVLTPFSVISGIAIDPLGNIYAADGGGIWELALGTPVITSISPTQAPEGQSLTVTINGTSFAADSVVTTCGPAIAVSNAVLTSATQITATFSINPVGPLGACAIGVSSATRGNTPAGPSFTVLIGPPALTSITPNSGLRGKAPVSVTIAGANLSGGTINPLTGVTISNATVVNSTSITATFTIAANAPLGPQNVFVTTPSGSNSQLVPFTINAPTPVLTGINPVSGPAGTTVAVTLSGTDLVGSTLNLPTGFTLSGTPVVAPAGTSITANLVIASTVSAGPKSITVTGPGGTSGAVTYTILPSLTSITPTSAKAGAATPVTLAGLSLSGVTTVNAGANITVSNVVVQSATSITATFTSALNATLGANSVTVTDANGASNSVTFTLTAPTPVLSTISPQTGGTGATVTLSFTGTGLAGATLTTPLPTGITLAGSATTAFGTFSQNITIAGNAPLGPASFTVTTAGGTSNALSMTVFALAPLLNTITPNTAAAGSTPTVVLAGRGFTGTTSLNFGAGSGISVLPGAFVVNSDAQITAQLTITAAATTTTLSVTNPNGTSNGVTFGIVPTLSSINPTSHPAGTAIFAVTLTGTSLTGASSINAGAGITVTALTVVSSTQITASFTIAATATQGNRSITVTTPGGTTNGVTFNVLAPPPVITGSSSPFKVGANNSGASLSGTNLTFTGQTISSIQLLLNGVSQNFGPVTNFQPTATQIRWNWTLPTTLPKGTYTMTVTTPSGTSAPFTVTLN
jgi:hypothetical protein